MCSSWHLSYGLRMNEDVSDNEGLRKRVSQISSLELTIQGANNCDPCIKKEFEQLHPQTHGARIY